jgi:hypothetical protein
MKQVVRWIMLLLWLQAARKARRQTWIALKTGKLIDRGRSSPGDPAGK